MNWKEAWRRKIWSESSLGSMIKGVYKENVIKRDPHIHLHELANPGECLKWTAAWHKCLEVTDFPQHPESLNEHKQSMSQAFPARLKMSFQWSASESVDWCSKRKGGDNISAKKSCMRLSTRQGWLCLAALLPITGPDYDFWLPKASSLCH